MAAARTLTKVTKLSNGLRVATFNTPSGGGEGVSPSAKIGLFVNAGTRNEIEDRRFRAVTHWLKQSAFARAQNNTSIEIVRGLELATGDTFKVENRRDHISYTGQVLTHSDASSLRNTVTFVEALSEIAFRSRFEEYELFELTDKATQLAHPSTASFLFDSVHSEAFRNTGLGLPLVPPPHLVRSVKVDDVHAYLNNFFTPDRAVLAGVSIDHEFLEKAAAAAFKSVPKKESTPTTKAEEESYTGGSARVEGPGPLRYALAFSGFGRNNLKDAAAGHVLASLLGGGTGSRVGLAKSEADKWIDSVSPFSENYGKSGLIGLVLIANEGNASKVAPFLINVVKKLAGSSINEAELKRAKAYTLGVLLKRLENKACLLEALGTQVLHSTSDEPASPTDLADQISAVTAADLSRVAKQVFSSRPTTVAVGDIYGLTDFNL